MFIFVPTKTIDLTNINYLTTFVFLLAFLSLHTIGAGWKSLKNSDKILIISFLFLTIVFLLPDFISLKPIFPGI